MVKLSKQSAPLSELVRTSVNICGQTGQTVHIYTNNSSYIPYALPYEQQCSKEAPPKIDS